MKLIYAYLKKDNQKIVYVGQTHRLKIRRYEHEVVEAFNSQRSEYNYPLSRAFRKYGVDAFECIILEENILNNDINEREKYWIKYYDTYHHGYNQTPGGEARIEITREDIDLIYQLLREGHTYKDISKKVHLCNATISAINNGIIYPRDNEQYPIVFKPFGKRLPEEIVDEIIILLQEKEIKVRDIAKIYNIGFNVVVRINSGESYRRDNLVYPLRKGRVRESKNTDYQELLKKVGEKLSD